MERLRLAREHVELSSPRGALYFELLDQLVKVAAGQEGPELVEQLKRARWRLDPVYDRPAISVFEHVVQRERG